jgi:subtilisin-like proprotein convertase family protein
MSTVNIGSVGTPGTAKTEALIDTFGDFVAVTFGGSADLWGLTLTPADVNSAAFGVFAEASTGVGSSGGTLDIDLIRLEIFYTLSVVPVLRIEPPLVEFEDYDAKTIYVELDWMTDDDHTHKPSQAVIDEIVATYARAGFQLILDVSNEIPHMDVFDIAPSLGSSPEIQALKDQYFDHRDDPNYYYSLWIHQYSQNGGSPTCSSGLGQLPGQVHLVSLGCFSGQTGTFSNQVGTFVHEFGHNLGIRHGGFQNRNYKPNYISVMNYHYQLNGVSSRISSRGWGQSGLQFNTFGLSNGLLGALNETDLDENLGIGLGRPVDFDCDADLTDPSIVHNIDEYSSYCSSISSLATVQDNDDWDDVRSLVGSKSFRAASSSSVDSEECISFDEYQLLPESANEAAIDARNRSAAKADNGTLGFPIKWFTIYNDGGADLIITAATPDISAPWLSFNPALPLTIPPGESRLLQLIADRQSAPAGMTTTTVSLTSNDPSAGGGFDWPEIEVTLPASPVPEVFSITRANADPANTSSVDFDVEFTEDVSGVDTSDFSLTTTGVTGAAITGVTGSGTDYTVTVATGDESGTIQCRLIDDDSITSDATSTALGTAGAGNGSFTGGEIYHIDKSEGAVFFSTDIPKALTDDGSTISVIVVPGAKAITTISDVNVTIDITHPNVEDLDVYLESPTGTVVELFTDVGGASADFTDTTLDDDASTAITAGSAPFTGSFVPEGNLDNYVGESGVGTWTLTVTDDTPGNAGTLNSWSLAISGTNIPQGVSAASGWAKTILMAMVIACALALTLRASRRRGRAVH